MPSSRLLIALSVMLGAYTFSVSSFPVLLPEVGVALGLADWQLGVVAAAFPFGRLMTNIPAGLLMTHHVRRALVGAPVLMIAGVVLVAGGWGFGWIVLGQVTMSIGYALGNLASITIILRRHAGTRLASALNVSEFSAMVAVLAAVTLVGMLPGGVPWNVAFLIGCAAIVVGVGALQIALKELPPTDATRPWFARVGSERSSSSGGYTAAVMIAFAAGGLVAVTYTTLASFLIPIRGSREFALERAGIARLMMLVQTCDIVALLPVGALADARGTSRVQAGVLLAVAAAVGLIGFGTLPHVIAGCAVFGLGMAGWMLPLGLLRAATPASQIAWRTALYRVFVDGGMFLGPFLSGLLAASHPGLLPGVLLVSLVLLAGVVLFRRPLRAAASV